MGANFLVDIFSKECYMEVEDGLSIRELRGL